MAAVELERPFVERLFLGRWGQITSFLQQVQLGLLLLEGTMLVQSASAEDAAHDVFPGSMNL